MTKLIFDRGKRRPPIQPDRSYSQQAAPGSAGSAFQPFGQAAQYQQPAQYQGEIAVAQQAQVQAIPQPVQPVQQGYDPNLKYCKYCGARIPNDAVVCTACGRQVEELRYAQAAQPQVVVNNVNTNTNTNVAAGRMKNKWLAFVLCFLFGWLGVHRFYEGKIGTGLLYMFTGGLFGIGWLIDLIILLCKPTHYYV